MLTWNRNISLRALRVFCVASETENFRVAAEKLFLTSSAVSHQIKALETELGRKLFVRSSRSLALTEFGEQFYSELVPAITELDRIVAQNSNPTESHSLRVSVQPFFASEMLMPNLHSFAALYPDIDTNIDATNDAPADSADAPDISIRIFSSPPSDPNSDRLFPLCLVPAGSPDFYDTIRVVAGRIVSDFPIIVHNSRPRAWRNWEKVARLRVPKDTPSIRFDSMTEVVRAAERGMGAALVPLKPSQSWFDDGGLVQLFDNKLMTSEAYYLVCHQAKPLPESVRVFRDWVLQKFGAEA